MRLRDGIRGLDHDHIEVQRRHGAWVLVRRPGSNCCSPVPALHDVTCLAEQLGHQAIHDFGRPA